MLFPLAQGEAVQALHHYLLLLEVKVPQQSEESVEMARPPIRIILRTCIKLLVQEVRKVLVKCTAQTNPTNMLRADVSFCTNTKMIEDPATLIQRRNGSET